MSEHRCLAGPGCRGAENTDDPATGRTIRRGAPTAHPDGLCDPCIGAATKAVDDMLNEWLALHISIGEAGRRLNQKVLASKSTPININTEADALKVAIVEWMCAAAARVSEILNIDDPHPRNNTDTEHASVLVKATAILRPHIDKLIDLPADEVTVWLSAGETQYPGERKYVDENGVTHIGTRVIPMSGTELALKLIRIRRDARSFLALTAAQDDKLDLPCPRCNEYQLTRTHRQLNTINGTTKDIDEINCAACKLNWPYEHYRNLCVIWVKEDEMEREKLQKQLDDERQRRETAEWLLAKRDWQLNLALDCPDVSASAFAATLLSEAGMPDDDTYVNDKDAANLVGVSDSTIRSWASRRQIERHTAEDGSTVYLAAEVWSYAKTAVTPRTSTVRRLETARKINDKVTS